MRINSILAAIAAASMAAAPVVAAPKPAPAPATEVAPAAETVEGEQIRGGFLLPLAVIIAIIIGVILLTGRRRADQPVSRTRLARPFRGRGSFAAALFRVHG